MQAKNVVGVVGFLALLLFTRVTYAGVDILNFTTTLDTHGVLLTWQTSNEIDHAFFRLWRSEENLPIVNGQIDTERATQISTTNIDSPSPCSVGGQSYNVQDRSVPDGAGTFYYYLESFNCSNGESVFKGEGSGGWQVQKITLFLPTLSRSQ